MGCGGAGEGGEEWGFQLAAEGRGWEDAAGVVGRWNGRGIGRGVVNRAIGAEVLGAIRTSVNGAAVWGWGVCRSGRRQLDDVYTARGGAA